MKKPATRLPSFKGFPGVDEGLRYAKDVIAGRIIVGKYARLACQRHIDDLKRRDWGYHYDPEAGERICKFLQLLPHTKGRWAQHRQRITLEPWQKFAFSVLFGWKRDKDDTRRFREATFLVPRKNGKSIIGAGIGLYMLTVDNEYGAEVYSGATTERQAWEVFKPAKLMLQKTPDLVEAFDIDVMAKSLSITGTGAKFEPVVGDPGDGSSPSCAIVDEYHEHLTSILYDTMQTGMGSRDQPLMLVITTAGNNLAGPCYEKQRECKQILDGLIADESVFALIYEADPGDDWADPKTLVKANPNYGVSVSADYLLEQQQKAIQSTAKQNTFRTKHLNQWVAAKSAWLNIQQWSACADASLRFDDFVQDRAVLVLDLASKIDIAAYLRIFERQIDGKAHYYAFPKFYLPEENAIQDKTGNYAKWAKDGHLILTDGDEISFQQIQDDVMHDLRLCDSQEVTFDPWRATHMAQNLAADGATMVEFRQTVQNMSPAMFELEAAIKSGRFHHTGNPVFDWMASNVVAKVDAKDNVYPRKEHASNKIDGIVAAIMGVGRMMVAEEAVSVYDERGLRTL